MITLKKLKKGFTLIELMIVVAIIGILAAIAIPNFIKYQLRSKFSEAATNLEGLRKAEEIIRSSERPVVLAGAIANPAGQYWNLGAKALPGTQPTTAKVMWTTVELGTASAIDWQVEGATYFQYGIGTGCGGGCFSAAATSNIDGSGVNGEIVLVKPDPTFAQAAWPAAPVLAQKFPAGAIGSTCQDAKANPVYGASCVLTGPDDF